MRNKESIVTHFVRFSEKNSYLVLFALLILLFLCFLAFFCLPSVASDGTSNNQDTALTVGGSIAGSTFLNQFLERFKPSKKETSQPPLDNEEPRSGFSLIGTALRVGALDKDAKATKTRVSVINRRVRHLETFLTKKFPEDFDPRNTS